MRPERWPGEPLIERLTIEERAEVQAAYMRQWTGARRRRLFDEKRRAEAQAARDARRAAFALQAPPPVTWRPYQGPRQPHPEGHRPYKPWDGRAPGVANLPR